MLSLIIRFLFIHDNPLCSFLLMRHWFNMLLLPITGYLLIPLTERGNVSRMREYRQLQTGKAVDRLYELMFTLREMRNKATSSFLVMKDLFIATAMVAPSKKSLEAYDAGTRVNELIMNYLWDYFVFMVAVLFIGRSHDMVKVGINSIYSFYLQKEKTGL